MCVYTKYVNQIWHPKQQKNQKKIKRMLFMIEKKNHSKIRNKQKKAGKLYNPVALSLPVFETATETAMTSVFKMQHMPQMFLQWLFTSRVKLYCSTARFITQPVAHRTGCIYWRDQVLQTISHSWKHWPDQTDQKPCYQVVTCSLTALLTRSDWFTFSLL